MVILHWRDRADYVAVLPPGACRLAGHQVTLPACVSLIGVQDGRVHVLVQAGCLVADCHHVADGLTVSGQFPVAAAPGSLSVPPGIPSRAYHWPQETDVLSVYGPSAEHGLDAAKAELDRLRQELVHEVKPRKQRKGGGQPNADTVRDSPAWDDEPEHQPH